MHLQNKTIVPRGGFGHSFCGQWGRRGFAARGRICTHSFLALLLQFGVGLHCAGTVLLLLENVCLIETNDPRPSFSLGLRAALSVLGDSSATWWCRAGEIFSPFLGTHSGTLRTGGSGTIWRDLPWGRLESTRRGGEWGRFGVEILTDTREASHRVTQKYRVGVASRQDQDAWGVRPALLLQAEASRNSRS